MIALRRATPSDLAIVLPRSRALNAHEHIEVDPPVFEAALARLLGDPTLGRVYVIERDAIAIGYAIVTFGYDLEFGGSEAWMTELWVDAPERGAGAGRAALELLADELRALGVHALHLQVRRENGAIALYTEAAFAASPRVVMTRRL